MRKRQQATGIGVGMAATDADDHAAGPTPLSRVWETALAALYWRAVESQRPDAVLNDADAVALVGSLGYDFESIARIPMPELLNVMRSMLALNGPVCAGFLEPPPGRRGRSHRLRPRHPVPAR